MELRTIDHVGASSFLLINLGLILLALLFTTVPEFVSAQSEVKPMPAVVDGSSIKELVRDGPAFDRFVDNKFRALDHGNKGVLSPKELQPAVIGIGGALGLPPKGASPDTDPIYDQVLDSFGKKVSKKKFSAVLREILLGLADGLEREPIKVISLDGRMLEEYANQTDAEVTAVNTFVDADAQSSGKVKASLLRNTLAQLSASHGAPPPGENTKPIMDAALKKAGVDEEASVSQSEFIKLFRKVLLEMAALLKAKPLTVAHMEKTFDGQSIRHLLSDKDALHKEIMRAWESLPKDKHGKVSEENLMFAVDALAPKAGLPPLGAVDEMDTVIMGALEMLHGSGKEELIDRETFDQYVRQVLGGLMLQLEGKPIVITSSSVVSEAQAGNPAAIF